MSTTKKTNVSAEFRISQLAYARFALFRDLFDWFAKPMTALDLNGLNAEANESPEVKAIWNRANEEWERITGIEPPTDEQSWQNAAHAAGWTNTKDVHGMKVAVLEWAREKQSQLKG